MWAGTQKPTLLGFEPELPEPTNPDRLLQRSWPPSYTHEHARMRTVRAHLRERQLCPSNRWEGGRGVQGPKHQPEAQPTQTGFFNALGRHRAA